MYKCSYHTCVPFPILQKTDSTPADGKLTTSCVQSYVEMKQTISENEKKAAVTVCLCCSTLQSQFYPGLDLGHDCIVIPSSYVLDNISMQDKIDKTREHLFLGWLQCKLCTDLLSLLLLLFLLLWPVH